MPFKNYDRRCHIPQQKHRVINSAAYDAALRKRGSLTVWFTDAAIGDWRAEPRTTPGGQPCYSPFAMGVSKTWGSLLPLSGIRQVGQPKAGK